jgi:cytochrome P450
MTTASDAAVDRDRDRFAPQPGLPPGPAGVPLLGLLPALRRDRLKAFEEVATYGPIARLKVPGRRKIFFISHPDLIRRVLQDNSANYRRSPLNDLLKPVMGEGLLTADGELWRRQRRLMQPAFHPRKIQDFLALMATATDDLARDWRQVAASGRPTDIMTDMSNLTLRIIIETMFGRAPTSVGEVSDAFLAAQEQIGRQFWALLRLPRWIPTPGSRQFRHGMAVLDRAVSAIINEHERQPATDGEGDLLDRLMAARDPETGKPMDRRQIRDEVTTIIIAGHETSATGLAWTFYLLSQNPEAAERLAAEAEAVLGDRAPEPDDLDRLSDTKRVIQESMRLYPPAPSFGRLAAGPDRLGGYEIPAGSIVVMSQHVMHRHPDWWDQPERFDPDRFTEAASADRPTYAYLPFGGGPRTCIGNHFAMIEMQLILAMLARRFRLELAPQPPIKAKAMITLRPMPGIQMKVVEQRTV